MIKPITNANAFAALHQSMLDALAKLRAPAIDVVYPKADEFLDLLDYYKGVAAAVDTMLLETAKIARANSSCHGIDIDLARQPLLGALDGFLFYDIEQEAVGIRAAYNACHGPNAYDRARAQREAA